MEGWLVGELILNGLMFSELEALSRLVSLKRQFSHALAVRPRGVGGLMLLSVPVLLLG